MLRAAVITGVIVALAAPSHAQPAGPDDLDELDKELDKIDPSVRKGDLIALTRAFIAAESRSYVADRDAAGNEQQLIGELRADIDLRFSTHLSGYVRPWFLIDALDTDLRRYEPLDGYLLYKRDTWDLELGQFVENWGMADTFNPVDVLCRRDMAVDFFDQVRRGEAGAKFRVITRPGKTIDELAVSVYAMPVWRPTPWPTANSRWVIGSDIAVLRTELTERPSLKDAFFGAVRIEHTLRTALANADVQYIAARGPDRFPVLVTVPTMGSFGFAPQYHGTLVLGFGIRAVPNAPWWSKLSFKAEVAHKRPYELASVMAAVPQTFAIAQAYTQFAVGLERGFDRVFATKDRLTALAEYIGDVGADDFASDLRPFDHDVAVALRWAANDFARTTIDARVIADVQNGDTIGELSVGRQLRFIHRDLRFTLAGRLIAPSDDPGSLLSYLPNNSNVTARLQLDL